MAGPRHEKTPGADRRQHRNAARRGDRIYSVQGLLCRVHTLTWVVRVHLVGRDGLVDVEGDRGDVADLSAGGQISPWTHRVTQVAHAAARAVLGRQETGQQ